MKEISWKNKTSRQNDKEFVKKTEGAPEPGTPEVKVTVKPGETNKQTRNKQKVKSFVDLVKKGLSPEDAAERIGLDLGEVANITTSRDLKRSVAEIIEMGDLRTEQRQALIRGGTNIMLTETIQQRDRKGFVDIAKLAMADPALGMSGPANANAVQVNVSILRDMMKGMDDDDDDDLPVITAEVLDNK